MARRQEGDYILRALDVSGYAVDVTKWEGGNPVATYRVEGGTCTCPAGSHATPCKHVGMAMRLRMRKQNAVPFDRARVLVRELLDAWGAPGSGFDSISFVEYTRNQEGAVLCAKLEGFGDGEGTYVGYAGELQVEVRCYRSAA